MAANAKEAKKRRKEIIKQGKEAAKRRKQLQQEAQHSTNNKTKKSKKKEAGAGGIKLAIAKAFPTFASVLKVKPADIVADTQSRPKKEFVGRTPSVNLLPTEYTVDRAVASTRRTFFIAATGVVGALSVVYFAQGAVTSIAEETFNVIQTQSVEAGLKTTEFTEVTAIYDQLSDRKSVIEGIKNNSPEYYAALAEIYRLTPQGTSLDLVSLQHIGLTLTAGGEEDENQAIAERCGPPIDPFITDLRPVSACLEFSGTSPSINDVYSLMERYRTSALLSNIVIEPDSGPQSNGAVGFRGTGALLAEADVSKVLTGDKNNLTGEVTFGGGDDNDQQAPPRTVPSGLALQPGIYTLTDNLELISSGGDIIAPSGQILFPDDSLAYVIYDGNNYQIDEAGMDVFERIIYSSDSEGGLLEPIAPSDPAFDGYQVSPDGNIVDPLTEEVIYTSDEWLFRRESNAYIVIATGEPIQMASIYYEGAQ